MHSVRAQVTKLIGSFPIGGFTSEIVKLWKTFPCLDGSSEMCLKNCAKESLRWPEKKTRVVWGDRFSFISGRVWVCWPSQSPAVLWGNKPWLCNLSFDRPDPGNSSLPITHTHTPSVFQYLKGQFHKQMF